MARHADWKEGEEENPDTLDGGGGGGGGGGGVAVQTIIHHSPETWHCRKEGVKERKRREKEKKTEIDLPSTLHPHRCARKMEAKWEEGEGCAELTSKMKVSCLRLRECVTYATHTHMWWRRRYTELPCRIHSTVNIVAQPEPNSNYISPSLNLMRPNGLLMLKSPFLKLWWDEIHGSEIPSRCKASLA